MNKYARVAESADARDLKSLGLTAVSVQIRSRAPKILRGIYKNTSLFCYKTTLGNDWGIKKPVFKGFMNNYEFSWKIIAHFSTQNRNRCGRNRSFCNLYGIKRNLSSDGLLVFFAFRQPQKGGFARAVKDKGGRFVYGFISYARKILLHRITRHICPNEGTYCGYFSE